MTDTPETREKDKDRIAKLEALLSQAAHNIERWADPDLWKTGDGREVEEFQARIAAALEGNKP